MEDRLDTTTFYREELPVLNTKHFAVILYDIKSNGEIILYNVVFEGDGAIQVIKLDGSDASPRQINIIVGKFSNGDRQRIKDFLSSVSKVSNRSDLLSDLLSLSAVQVGGRRKYKRKRRSKTKKKSKRRKSKRRKYKKKRNTRRKSKSK